MPESWDVEVCHEGEADLYKHHKSCQKHPDHTEFIPVDKFDINHLPTDYQIDDIVEYIKLVAQLTVRLTASYVSPDRPATIPGTETPYPFYENRGQNVMRVGSGIIKYVAGKYIFIKTATHVVFDKDEAKNTICHLFYDNGDQPAVCNNVIEVKCNDPFVSSDPIVDESLILIDLSCNKLIQKITSIYFKMLELQPNIRNSLSESSYEKQSQPLTFIVSHPHGFSKKISFGRRVEVDYNLDDVRFLYTTPTCPESKITSIYFKMLELQPNIRNSLSESSNDTRSEFLYTTPTCPGSSGATVICLKKETWKSSGVHSGTLKDGAGLNLGLSRNILFGVSPTLNACHKVYEDRRLMDLKFCLWCTLPCQLNYNLMYDYIKVWTFLCVRVDVNYISEQRPEFWPGSELLYPWYKKRGSREKRQGCGWVDRVVIYPSESSPSKTCDCDLCRDSSTPENNFAHIYILTSTSHVFNQTEGRKTTCFYVDSTLFDSSSGTQPVSSDVETDRCQLVFVTHDLNFTKKLNMLLEHVSFLKEKIQDKYSPQLSANPVSIKIGRHSNATIGHCVRVDKHLVYTNKDEQVDVGAPIIVLGNKHLHVDVSAHTGQYSLDPKYGYSRHLDYQYKSTQLIDLLPD